MDFLMSNKILLVTPHPVDVASPVPSPMPCPPATMGVEPSPPPLKLNRNIDLENSPRTRLVWAIVRIVGSIVVIFPIRPPCNVARVRHLANPVITGSPFKTKPFLIVNVGTSSILEHIHMNRRNHIILLVLKGYCN
jgi:hypothetical protein